MCTYLAKRGSTYYFRRTVPAELRAALNGRTEFMFSIGTKVRDEAKRRIPAHTVATEQLLADAAARVACAAPESPAQDAAEPVASLTPGEREQALYEAQRAKERAARYEARSPERAELRRKLAEFQSVDMPMPLQAMRDLLRERDDALARAMAKFAEKEEGKPAESLPAAVNSGAMLDTTIVDLWAAERKPVQKGIDTHRAVARWFYERVGRKPVGSITRQDVLAFKAKLLAEGTSPANTKVKLSRLRTLLKWAADNDHAPSNVAEGITIKDSAQAKNKRVEFDLPALGRIFSTPIYAAGARPTAGKGEAAYWLPLLALFTGARLEELGQLRVADVQEMTYPDHDGAEAKAWFLHIREDKEDDLTLKNAASERDVPVHPELERLGFLRFVADARQSGATRLFPKLTPNVYGRLTAKWGEWFGSHLRGACAVPDRRMVFHSFRHTFKQYARHAGIVEGVQRQIMGHSSGDVADSYGSGYPLHQIVEGMRIFRVPGLPVIPSPYLDSSLPSSEE
jgi:integrase